MPFRPSAVVTNTIGMVLPPLARTSLAPAGRLPKSVLELAKTTTPTDLNDLKASELAARQDPHVVPGSVKTKMRGFSFSVAVAMASSMSST